MNGSPQETEDPTIESWRAELARLRDSDDYTVWRSTAARADRDPQSRQGAQRAIRLAVLTTYTSDLVTALLPTAGLVVDTSVDVYQAPYGQVEQELLQDTSPLHAFAPDYVLLSGTAEDVLTPGWRETGPDAAVAAAVGRAQDLWRAAARAGVRVIQHNYVLPVHDAFANASATASASATQVVRRVNAELAERARDDVLVVDCDALAAEFGRSRWRDSRYWFTVRQPVALTALPHLAKATMGVLAADLGLTRRCVVLDLDNTLWGGILGEDGVTGVQVGQGYEGEAFAAFQEYLLDLKARGVMLAVSSKNDLEHVRLAFESIPGMRLRWEDFAVVRADWRPKSVQVTEIAEQVNLGLSSLVFVDDNPAERDQVAHALPEVDVVALPERARDYVRALAGRPTLQVAALTDADQSRSRSVQGLARAEEARGSAASLEDFLAGLGMTAQVSPVTEETLPRATQMVAKTNQFNLTVRRRTQAELGELIADHRWVCRTLTLRDRFADHGIVGLALVRIDAPEAVVDTLLLSCRVIGRTAERTLLRAIAADLARRGVDRMVGLYTRAERNELVSDLYPQLGFREVAHEGHPRRFECSLDVVEALKTPYVELETTDAQ